MKYGISNLAIVFSLPKSAAISKSDGPIPSPVRETLNAGSNSPITNSSIEWSACIIVGDMNFDGELNVVDVIMLVNIVLEG